MSSHIANTTREIQDNHDRAVLTIYADLRVKLEAAVKAAQAELDKAGDDETEVWAAQHLREALQTLANHEATYRHAKHRRARREAEDK